MDGGTTGAAGLDVPLLCGGGEIRATKVVVSCDMDAGGGAAAAGVTVRGTKAGGGGATGVGAAGAAGATGATMRND